MTNLQTAAQHALSFLEGVVHQPDCHPTDRNECTCGLRQIKFELTTALATLNDCASEKCSYFTHYLVYHDPTKHGPAIPHPSFHIAEANCSHWQAIAAEHQDQGRSVPQSVEKQCCFWEAKIHA